MGANARVAAAGVGDIRLVLALDGEPVPYVLKEALQVASLTISLLSGRKMIENVLQIVFVSKLVLCGINLRTWLPLQKSRPCM